MNVPLGARDTPLSLRDSRASLRASVNPPSTQAGHHRACPPLPTARLGTTITRRMGFAHCAIRGPCASHPAPDRLHGPRTSSSKCRRAPARPTHGCRARVARAQVREYVRRGLAGRGGSRRGARRRAKGFHWSRRSRRGAVVWA